MGCCGEREKAYVEETAKWDYITLDDFHPRSSWTPITYLWIWFMAFVGVAVFAADIFTAVNLLAFDKWSGSVQPALPLKYSKWIFAVCIVISFLLYAYQWTQAIRVIRRGGVAESYMNPLAVQLQSMRGKGWKRFLVFTELTKNRKGADYVALFVYFQFQGSFRILFAEAGRQVVNGITLWTVMQSDFMPTGQHAAKNGQSPILQFFSNVEALYNTDKEQAVVIFTMLFTLIIFVFSALSLIAALLCYITFLWHYIPQGDGRLSIYCRRKIDKRLEKIVESKVKAALGEQEKKRQKEEARIAKKAFKDKNPSLTSMKKQPTLPDLTSFDSEKQVGASLVRQDTQSSLPSYSSRSPSRNGNMSPLQPGLVRQPTLPDVGIPEARPATLSRTGTQASVYSNHSFASNAPLLNHADDMGMSDSRSTSPAVAMPPITRQMSSSSYRSRPGPARTLTQSSQGSQHSYGRTMPPPVERSNTAPLPDSGRNPLSRAGSAMSGLHPYGPPRRQPTLDTFTIHEQPSREGTPGSNYTASVYSQLSQNRQLSRTSFNRPFSQEDRPIVALSRNPTIAETMRALREDTMTPALTIESENSGYVAFNPGVHRSPSVPAPLQFGAPRRQLTNPTIPARHNFAPPPVQRSVTAPPTRGAYDDVLDEYGESSRF